MLTFTYTAIDAATGRERAGELEGTDAETVAGLLKSRGLWPTVLAPRREQPTVSRPSSSRVSRGLRHWRRPNGSNALTIFTRQLSALISAGVPLVRSLELLARQEANPAWQAIIVSLADGIRSGGTFSDGLAQHSKVFDHLYLGMVKAGESSGALEIVLERLARHREKTARLKGRVKSALTYPLVIMTVATTMVAGLMVFVVPKFEAIFAGLLKGAPLPVLTQVVLTASRFMQGHWFLVAGTAVAAGLGLRWLLQTEGGSHLCDRTLLRMPVIGALVLKTALARLNRTLGTMLASGVPILQALDLARETGGNRVIADAIATVQRRVREGEGMARPLAESRIFPAMVTGMVEVGEETGTLPDMLARVADIYDEEVDQAVAALTSLLEPFMIVLMAVMVGTIVIALFLPIVRIIQLMT